MDVCDFLVLGNWIVSYAPLEEEKLPNKVYLCLEYAFPC